MAESLAIHELDELRQTGRTVHGDKWYICTYEVGTEGLGALSPTLGAQLPLKGQNPLTEDAYDALLGPYIRAIRGIQKTRGDKGYTGSMFRIVLEGRKLVAR